MSEQKRILRSKVADLLPTLQGYIVLSAPVCNGKIKNLIHYEAFGSLLDMFIEDDELPEGLFKSIHDQVVQVSSNLLIGINHVAIDDITSMSHAYVILERQASMFVALITEVWKSSDSVSSLSLSMVTPALHGIIHCLQSGWKPNVVSELLLEVLMYILFQEDNSNCNLELNSLVTLAKEITKMFINLTPCIKNQVLKSLLHSLKQDLSDKGSQNKILSLTDERLRILLESCNIFSSDSFVGMTSKCIKREKESSVNLNGGSSRKVSNWRAMLSLGDELEVLQDDMWRLGTVVKLDSIRNQLLIEFSDSLCVYVGKDSDTIRQCNNNTNNNIQLVNDNIKGSPSLQVDGDLREIKDNMHQEANEFVTKHVVSLVIGLLSENFSVHDINNELMGDSDGKKGYKYYTCRCSINVKLPKFASPKLKTTVSCPFCSTSTILMGHSVLHRLYLENNFNNKSCKLPILPSKQCDPATMLPSLPHEMVSFHEVIEVVDDEPTVFGSGFYRLLDGRGYVPKVLYNGMLWASRAETPENSFSFAYRLEVTDDTGESIESDINVDGLYQLRDFIDPKSGRSNSIKSPERNTVLHPLYAKEDESSLTDVTNKPYIALYDDFSRGEWLILLVTPPLISIEDCKLLYVGKSVNESCTADNSARGSCKMTPIPKVWKKIDGYTDLLSVRREKSPSSVKCAYETNISMEYVELVSPLHSIALHKNISLNRKKEQAANAFINVIETIMELECVKNKMVVNLAMCSSLNDDRTNALLEKLMRSFYSLIKENINSIGDNANTLKRQFFGDKGFDAEDFVDIEDDCYHPGDADQTHSPTGPAESQSLPGSKAAIISEDLGASSISRSKGYKTLFSVIQGSDSTNGHCAPQETCASVIFEYILREITMILTEYADTISNLDQVDMMLIQRPQIVDSCISIISLISQSKFRITLVKAFYRNLILRCGIKVHLAAQCILRNPLSHDFENNEYSKVITNFMTRASLLEKIYKNILVLCVGAVSSTADGGSSSPDYYEPSNRVYSYLAMKLTNTVRSLGISYVVNGLIEHTGSADTLIDAKIKYNNLNNGLKAALKRHILLNKDRLSLPARKMRQFVSVFSAHADTKNVVVLERLWRENITEYVIEECTYVIKTSVEVDLVNHLVKLLQTTRDISRIDLAVTKHCHMSADLAFMKAYTKLPKDLSTELSKALAVYISSLLDTFKHLNLNMNEAQADSDSELMDFDCSIIKVTDLIRVLCGQTTEEFQYFYELLLTKRLLRNRFLSLDTEKYVLSLLPAMSKSKLMIKDIEQTVYTMKLFRKYMLDRYDYDQIEVTPNNEGAPQHRMLQFPSNNLKELIFNDNNLNVHVLAGSIWPTAWVSPLPYSSINLPAEMKIVSQEFQLFFKINSPVYKKDLKGDAVLIRSNITVNNETIYESLLHIDGVYDITCDTLNGFPIYAKSNNYRVKFILEFNANSNAYEIKSAHNKATDICIAYCKFPMNVTGSYTSNNVTELMSKLPWMYYHNNAWCEGNFTVEIKNVSNEVYATLGHQGTSRGSVNIFKSLKELEVSSIKSMRKIVWCHGAGTVLLKGWISGPLGRTAAFLLTSTPQAVLLLMFNEGDIYTIPEIIKYTGMTYNEIKDVLASLLSPSQPILCEVTVNSAPCYRLSDDYVYGNLGGLDSVNPIILSSQSALSNTINNNDVNVLHAWRNDLIDACIVRILKEAARTHSGNFMNSAGTNNTAVPLDVLLKLVKDSLENRCSVNSEDVMRRSERLAAISIIEKVKGNNDTFRSVAYCYLPDKYEDENDYDIIKKSAISTADISDGIVFSKLVGEDLYDHLRYVLRINKLVNTAVGIHYDIFLNKFIKWIGQAPCVISSYPSASKTELSKKHTLDIVAEIIIQTVIATMQQVYALHAQHLEGVSRTDDTVSDIAEDAQFLHLMEQSKIAPSLNMVINLSCVDDIPTYLLSSSLKRSSEVNDACASIAALHFSVPDLSKVYYDHLPPLEREIVTYFYYHRLNQHKTHIQASLATPGDYDHLWYAGVITVPLNFLQSVLPHTLLSSLLNAVDLTSIPTGDLSVAMSEKAFSEGKVSEEIQVSRDSALSSYVTFQQFFHAILSSLESFDSKRGDLSKPMTLLGVLDTILYEDLCSHIHNLFKDEDIEFLLQNSQLSSDIDNNSYRLYVNERFNHEETVPIDETVLSNPSDDENPGDDEDDTEIMLPCEFCPDIFPISILHRHQLMCREIRGLPPNNTQQLLLSRNTSEVGSDPNDNNESGISTQKISKIASISNDCRVNLVLSLMDAISKSILLAQHVNNGPNKAEKVEQTEPNSMRSILLECFRALDRNNDGYLTIEDFSASKNSLRDHNRNLVVSELSPSKLYSSPDRSFNLTDGEDATELSNAPLAGPLLTKFDSFWASIAQTKLLPSPTQAVSRSLGGLDEAEVELQNLITRTCEFIRCNEEAAIVLLIYYKWDAKSLIEDYIDNYRIVRQSCGLGPIECPSFLRYDIFGVNTSATYGTAMSLVNSSVGKNNSLYCGICGDTVLGENAYALPCCHYYCNECWEGYFHNAIYDRQVKIKCPKPNCIYTCTFEMIAFISPPNDLKEAKSVLLKSFVEESKYNKTTLVSYCKNPKGCNGVLFLADDANCSEAFCSLCSSTFCASCDYPPHSPATCELVRVWESNGGYLETGRDEDMEARKLKHLTTKPCPKCGSRIEKNGGCPHMTCRCKYQFCWDCGGDYHTSVTCTRPKVEADNGTILHFNELDKQVANHFLARQIALKGKKSCYTQLELNQRPEISTILRIKAEGWEILAQAQAALAYSCIVEYNNDSFKFRYLFETQRALTQSLQQKFEEAWVLVDNFPEIEARDAVRYLRMRLKEYLLVVNTEIISVIHSDDFKPSVARNISPPGSPSSDDGRRHKNQVPIFGNAFKHSSQAIKISLFK